MENLSMFNITSKYFRIFNNTLPASWVEDISRFFLTCYSCLYHRFMIWIIIICKRGHPFSTYAKSSENLIFYALFLTHLCAIFNTRVLISQFWTANSWHLLMLSDWNKKAKQWRLWFLFYLFNYCYWFVNIQPLW